MFHTHLRTSFSTAIKYFCEVTLRIVISSPVENEDLISCTSLAWRSGFCDSRNLLVTANVSMVAIYHYRGLAYVAALNAVAVVSLPPTMKVWKVPFISPSVINACGSPAFSALTIAYDAKSLRSVVVENLFCINAAVLCA